jgi:hypothetical protein
MKPHKAIASTVRPIRLNPRLSIALEKVGSEGNGKNWFSRRDWLPMPACCECAHSLALA